MDMEHFEVQQMGHCASDGAYWLDGWRQRGTESSSVTVPAIVVCP